MKPLNWKRLRNIFLVTAAVAVLGSAAVQVWRHYNPSGEVEVLENDIEVRPIETETSYYTDMELKPWRRA